MPKQKKQHYVPQCVLKNFTDNQNKFYLFQALKNRIIDRMVPYKDHCYTDYLYGKDGEWENWLGAHETEIAPIFRLILNNTSLSYEQEILVKRFILVQHMRTEKAIDRNCNLLTEIYEKIIPVLAKHEGMQISSSDAKLFARNQIKDIDRTEIAVQDMTFVEENISHFDDLRLLFLTTTSDSFVCSDHPVSIANLYHKNGGIGIDCAGLIVTMPLSPKVCLLLLDDGIYDYENGSTHIAITESDVKALNRRQFVQSKEILFSLDKAPLEYVKRHFEQLYIDMPLRDLLRLRWGLTDPILLNLKTIELKKTYRNIIDEIIPKQYAQDDFKGLANITIKPEFIPYGSDINSMFYRFGSSNDVPDKYSFVGENYPDVIRNYYIRKGR